MSSSSTRATRPRSRSSILRERVLEVIGYRPFEADRRVFIIDPADEMTVEAQDALLKTLEEPPPAAILVLVTAYADTLAADDSIALPSHPFRAAAGVGGRPRPGRAAEDRSRQGARRWRPCRAAASRARWRRSSAISTSDRAAALALVEAGRGARRRQAQGRGASSPSTARTAATAKRSATGSRSSRRSCATSACSAPARRATLANSDLERELRALASTYDLPRAHRGLRRDQPAPRKPSTATPARRSSPTGWRSA